MRDVFGPDQADAAKHTADDQQPAEQEYQGHGCKIRVDQRDYAGDHEKDALEQIPGRITLDRLAHGLAHSGRRLCHCHRHLTVLPKEQSESNCLEVVEYSNDARKRACLGLCPLRHGARLIPGQGPDTTTSTSRKCAALCASGGGGADGAARHKWQRVRPRRDAVAGRTLLRGRERERSWQPSAAWIGRDWQRRRRTKFPQRHCGDRFPSSVCSSLKQTRSNRTQTPSLEHLVIVYFTSPLPRAA